MELTPPEETMKHLTTNVLGPMLCSQAFARMYFEAAGNAAASTNPPPPGRIVSISSQAAHVALHRHGAYCASKAALLGLARSMASEWAPRGITSNTVSPTVAWTALGKKAWGEDAVREAFLKNIPTGKFALPEDVADAVLFLCQVSFMLGCWVFDADEAIGFERDDQWCRYSCRWWVYYSVITLDFNRRS
jgi:NAD(P)-dependent dehydrogenase (short-subunit alcohol dehydrogenase family)